MDRIIIEFLQDIVSVLEDHLRPLVEAELSVLVDILYRPELLFPGGTDARRKCENGGFIRYYNKHTYYASHRLESLDSVCLLLKPATVAGFKSKHTESRLSSRWDA